MYSCTDSRSTVAVDLLDLATAVVLPSRLGHYCTTASLARFPSNIDFLSGADLVLKGQISPSNSCLSVSVASASASGPKLRRL
jgi:hypothetical protein